MSEKSADASSGSSAWKKTLAPTLKRASWVHLEICCALPSKPMTPASVAAKLACRAPRSGGDESESGSSRLSSKDGLAVSSAPMAGAATMVSATDSNTCRLAWKRVSMLCASEIRSINSSNRRRARSGSCVPQEAITSEGIRDWNSSIARRSRATVCRPVRHRSTMENAAAASR